MSRNVKFAMNTGHGGGQTIIQEMARPAVVNAAEKIANRANRISSSIREHPQRFETSEVSIGIPNRYGGSRVYAKIEGQNPNHSSTQYELDYQALRLALDAGRLGQLGG